MCYIYIYYPFMLIFGSHNGDYKPSCDFIFLGHYGDEDYY